MTNLYLTQLIIILATCLVVALNVRYYYKYVKKNKALPKRWLPYVLTLVSLIFVSVPVFNITPTETNAAVIQSFDTPIQESDLAEPGARTQYAPSDNAAEYNQIKENSQ